MENDKNQVTNLETMASRYVLLALSYNALKNPNLTRDERKIHEKKLHDLLDVPPSEFSVIGQILSDNLEQKSK